MRERLTDKLGEEGGCRITENLITKKKILCSQIFFKPIKKKGTNLVILLKRLPELTNNPR